jgi:hypothetical protein
MRVPIPIGRYLIVAEISAMYKAAFALVFVMWIPAFSFAAEEKTYEIRKLEDGESIKLDGLLSEPAWARANVAGDFYQQVPDEGELATQKTEAHLLYDDKNIYVGIRCWQTDRIVVTDIHRDFAIMDNDLVEIVFDAFKDSRNSLTFITNPMGALSDVQFSSDGVEANQNWNAVWDVKTHLYDDSWTVEMIIPFKSLRFKKSEIQEWGLNIMRRARYINEGSCWSFVPRRFKVGMVSLAGTMTGLRNVKPGRNLKLKPFVVGSAIRIPSRPGKPDFYPGKIGLDLKYGVTTGLTLDFTANTDFSQVEADVQQINLTRFSLFYPEKREFFLENSNLFHMGEVLNMGSSDVMLFYSRRIGLDQSGMIPIPLLGGIRLSGHADKYELGFLDMQSKEFGSTPANNFTVARIRRSISRNSDFGAMFINRQATSVENDYNRVYGIDANLRLTQDLVFNSFLAKSQTPEMSGKDWAGGATLTFSKRSYTLGGKYREVQPNFRSEVGYVPRTDVRLFNGNFAWLFHPEDFLQIREIRPNVTVNNFLTTENELDTRTVNTGINIEFHNGAVFKAWREQSHEILRNDFRPFPDRVIPPGSYAYAFYHVEYTHDDSRILSPNFQFEKGGYYDGDRTKLGGGIKFHPNAKLSFTASIERNNVDIPSGTYGTNLIIWRINYSFTTRMFLDALVQYNSVTGLISSNIRFNLIHHPLSDLFVVYNDNHDRRTGDLVGRALSVKFTHLLDF